MLLRSAASALTRLLVLMVSERLSTISRLISSRSYSCMGRGSIGEEGGGAGGGSRGRRGQGGRRILVSRSPARNPGRGPRNGRSFEHTPHLGAVVRASGLRACP